MAGLKIRCIYHKSLKLDRIKQKTVRGKYRKKLLLMLLHAFLKRIDEGYAALMLEEKC